MRFALLILTLFCLSVTARCQKYVTAQGILIRPTGKFGYAFAPQFGFGIRRTGEFDDSRRYNAGGMIFFMHPREAEIPAVGSTNNGNGTFVSLGTQRYTQFNIAFFDVSYDYAFVEKEKYYLFGGFGIGVGGVNMKYKSDLPLISGVTYSGGEFLATGLFRVGIEYMFNDDYHAHLEGERRYFFITGIGGYSANFISLGFSKYFD